MPPRERRYLHAHRHGDELPLKDLNIVNRRNVNGAAAWRAMAWAAAVTALAGCSGSDRGGVVGTVTRSDGAPLVGARVTARSDVTGKWATGITDDAGRFELGAAEAGDGIPPGEYYVKINEDRGSWDNPRPRTIAAKYEDPKQSGLKVAVEAGKQASLELKLESL